MTTVTQWFGKKTKPVNIGSYERRWNGISLCPGHWNGKKFVKPDGSSFGIQSCEWRGLAVKP